MALLCRLEIRIPQHNYIVDQSEPESKAYVHLCAHVIPPTSTWNIRELHGTFYLTNSQQQRASCGSKGFVILFVDSGNDDGPTYCMKSMEETEEDRGQRFSWLTATVSSSCKTLRSVYEIVVLDWPIVSLVATLGVCIALASGLTKVRVSSLCGNSDYRARYQSCLRKHTSSGAICNIQLHQ